MSLSNNKPKELVILTEHFAPSTGATAQLVTDLANDLHRMDVRIRVLTSTAGPADNPYPVHRFSVSSTNAVGILQKLTNGLFFFFGSAYWLLTKIKRHQSLFIVSNPPFIGLIGVLLLAFRGTRYVFLFQDIFPRSASLTGILPAQGPLISLWHRLLKIVLTRSESTVVLSESMIRRCNLDFGHELDLSCIPNWAVFSPHSISKTHSSFASTWGVEDIFTVQYSGNFGRLHDILTILEAARLLQSHQIQFIFVGGGAKSSQIHCYCNRYGLSNVLIKPYLPRTLLSDSLAACDISIVSLITGSEDTVAPSKFYGIIACSRPVLLISSKSSELASLITTFQCGAVVPQGDVILLAEQILFLKDNPNLVAEMGIRSRRLYEEKYGRSRSVAEYYQLFRRLDMV